MGTWEAVLITVAWGLANGGTAGLIYTFIGVWIGFTLTSVSMAEMASSCPTAGGQYHWVSEYAPSKYQKQLSYLIGWMVVLGAQAGVTIGAFIAGTMIQGLLVLNYPSYDFQHWHGTLIAIAVTTFGLLVNIFLAALLPLVEYLCLILHTVGWIVILVTLWVLAPTKAPSNQVWTNFADAGWGNTGVATLVGIITPVGGFIGGDAPAHMSEEVRDASRDVPRVMIWTMILNGGMGLIMLM